MDVLLLILSPAIARVKILVERSFNTRERKIPNFDGRILQINLSALSHYSLILPAEFIPHYKLNQSIPGK